VQAYIVLIIQKKCKHCKSGHYIGPFVWLVTSADLFREKSTADWLLMADLFLWEKRKVLFSGA
jgi:hypothetical protein